MAGGVDRFTVYAYDINTNTLICELPAAGLTFDRRLNDTGSIGFTLNLLDPHAAAQADPFLAYYRAQVPVAFYVDRDGVLVWGGIQTTGGYTHSGHTLPIQGREWPAYFAQRLIAAPYDKPTYPSGIDPALLLSKAVTDCQNTALAGPGANVGVAVTGGSSSVPWVTPSYSMQQTFVSQVVADCVAGVTPGAGGVDYWMDVAWSPSGFPSVTMRIASPRAGRAAGTTSFAIDLLNTVDFTWPQDYQQACTTLFETGGGSGQVAPASTVATSTPVGGLGQSPRFDKVLQHSNVLSPEWLSQLAQGEAQRFTGAVVTPTVILRTADETNPLGTWIPGDDCRLIAEPFELYPAGIDEYWRVVMHAVTVPDDGAPTVTLTFNAPPQF